MPMRNYPGSSEPEDLRAAERRLEALKSYRDEALVDILALLDELNVIPVLRQHVPAAAQYRIDRLETALRALERLGNQIETLDCQIALMEEKADI